MLTLTTLFSKRIPYLVTLSAAILLGCTNNETANAEHDVTSSVNSKTTDTSATMSTIPSDATVVSALQKNLTNSGIEANILSATPTDMPDIYWVTGENMPAFFTDKTGQHIIQGQIVRIGEEQPIDITAKFQSQAAKQQLANVRKEDMIIFPANGTTKGVIYAFTDADCGYCRKLHSEMKQINDLGIEVRYLAWPRSQATVPKMEAIWCSKDRNAAMNTAKSGGNVSAASCDNPVEAQVALGLSLGVRGTPAVFTESGEQIGGYLPADQIAEALNIQ